MLWKLFAAAGLLLMVAPVLASASALTFDFKDPKQISAVALSLDSRLEPIVGYANGISGLVQFDPQHPEQTTGQIAVAVASVQFANEGYTATARGFALDGERHPQIFFTIRKVVSVTRPSINTVKASVQADFTCRGVTLPMTVAVSGSYYPGKAEERTNGKFKGDILVIRTNFQVSRRALGISQGIPDSMVGDSVEVRVAVTGIHYAEPSTQGATPPPAEAAAPPLRDHLPTANTAPVRIDAPAPIDFALPRIGPGRDGQPLNLAAARGSGNLVLFFFSEQCGVTFQYKSRLQRLQRDFAGKGFTFVGVRCGATSSPQESGEIAEAKYLKIPYVDDRNGAVPRTFHIRQSLTFAVIDSAGVLRYHGGFDDNVSPPRVTHNYLRNALLALSTGGSVPIKEGRAIGCAIVTAP